MIHKLRLHPFFQTNGGASGIKRGGGKTAGTPAVSIPEAKTIAEANAIAVQYGLADRVDFGTLDVNVANEALRAIYEIKQVYPDFPTLEVLGTTKVARLHFGGAGSDGDNYAFIISSGYNLDKMGLGINQKYFSSGTLSTTLKRLTNEVKSQWSPLGSGSVKSIIDHEIGHVLDRKLGISDDRRIKQLFRQNHDRRNSKKMGSVLSRYANTNTREFIAEAWSEYRNNPNPRPVAREVGDIIMSYIGRRNI